MAFIVLRYGKKLAEMSYLRNAVIVTFVLAFGAAAIAGLFGALITKAAPYPRDQACATPEPAYKDV